MCSHDRYSPRLFVQQFRKAAFPRSDGIQYRSPDGSKVKIAHFAGLGKPANRLGERKQRTQGWIEKPDAV
jgi:hypothetical protein